MSFSIRVVRGLSLVVLVATGCTSGDARPAAVRTDSAGIEIVESTGTDHALSWRFEPTVTIASDETSGAGVFDPNEYALDADSAGRLYLMDRAGHRIIVFGADGRFLHSLGRQGGGPGEFNFPLALSIAHDGTTSLFDVSKRKLVRFGPDAAILPERELGPGFFGGKIHSNRDEYIYDYHARGHAGGLAGLYRANSSGGSVLLESADPPTKSIELKSCGMSFSGMPPLLAPSYRWDAQLNRIALAREAAYDIAVYDAARLIRRIRRDIESRAATAALAQQDVGEGMRVGTEGGERVCSPDEVVQQRGFAPTIPAISRIALAPDGALWVRRGGVKGEALPIDVFASDGSYEGTLPPETPFPAAFLSNDRIATVVKDEMDVGRIVVYEIKR